MRTRRRARADERGAVAMIVALTLTLVLVAAAFAIDLGMQRVVRRDMQALADVVALDAARLLDGRVAGDVRAGSGAMRPLQAVVADSVDRNDDSTLGDAPAVVPYLVELDDDGDYAVDATGLPVQAANSAVPDGVVVTAASSIAFAFAGITGVGDGSASRAAVGTASRTACFQLGSYAASLQSDESLLGPLNDLLGIDLDLVSYRGLLGADLSLLDLVRADPTLGSPEDVLTSGVSMGELVDAGIAALQQSDDSGPSTSAAIAALRALEVAGGFDPTARVVLGDLLNVDVGDDAALDSSFNLLDLFAGALGVATGSNFGDLGLRLAGIDAVLRVVQRQQRACGTVGSPRAVARSSQVTIDATVPESSLRLPASVLGVTLSAPGGLRVVGGVGNAEGRLVAPAPQCRSGTVADPDLMNVDVSSGLAGLDVSTRLRLNGIIGQDALPAGLLGDLVNGLFNLLSPVRVRIDNLTISARATSPGTGGQSGVRLRVPQNAANTTPPGQSVTVGSQVRVGDLDVAGGTQVTGRIVLERRLVLLGPWTEAAVLDLDDRGVGDLLDLLLGGAVQPVLDGVVTSLNGSLLPLVRLLGLDVGGARVWSVARPLCGTPVLIGGGAL